MSISLTALRRREDVEGRVLDPGRDRHVFLNERGYLTPEHTSIPW